MTFVMDLGVMIALTELVGLPPVISADISYCEPTMLSHSFCVC